MKMVAEGFPKSENKQSKVVEKFQFELIGLCNQMKDTSVFSRVNCKNE